jgi:hypothetical protein
MNILTDLQALVDDSGVFWTQGQMLDMLNLSLLECARACDVNRTTSQLLIAPNDVFIAIPSDIMVPKAIINDEGECFVVPQVSLERYASTWRASTPCKPVSFVQFDAYTLRIWPPSDASYIYTVEGLAWPAEITAGAANLTYDHPFVHGVMYRAAAQLVESTLPQAADTFLHLSDIHLGEYKANIRKRGGHTFLRMRPANKTQRAHGGNIRIVKDL